MRIDIDLTTLDNERPTEVIECYLLLEENHLNYKLEYYADIRDSEDEAMPFEKDVYHCLDEIIGKDAISGVYLSWRRKLEQWKILISATGLTDDIYMMFTDAVKAKSIFKKIKEWKYGL